MLIAYRIDRQTLSTVFFFRLIQIRNVFHFYLVFYFYIETGMKSVFINELTVNVTLCRGQHIHTKTHNNFHSLSLKKKKGRMVSIKVFNDILLHKNECNEIFTTNYLEVCKVHIFHVLQYVNNNILHFMHLPKYYTKLFIST